MDKEKMSPTQKAAFNLLQHDFRYLYTILGVNSISPPNYSIAMIPYCRFVNDVLHRRKSAQGLFWRAPVKGSHREIVVLSLPLCKLSLEILKRIEGMRRIKLLVVLAVAALYFSIVSGGKWLNKFVLDSQVIKGFLKQSLLPGAVRIKTIGKFKSVVSLDTLNGIRKCLDYVLDEFSR